MTKAIAKSKHRRNIRVPRAGLAERVTDFRRLGFAASGKGKTKKLKYNGLHNPTVQEPHDG
jgi:hypothetical protein